LAEEAARRRKVISIALFLISNKKPFFYNFLNTSSRRRLLIAIEVQNIAQINILLHILHYLTEWEKLANFLLSLYKWQWCDASGQIFIALVLASVLEISVLVSVLSGDRDQETNLQRKMQHNTH